MDNITTVIDEILKFSPRVLTVNNGITEDELRAFEQKIKLQLPKDYITFLKTTNGIDLMGSVVYGLRSESTPNSLECAWNIEHYEVENEMPIYLIPFSPDGGGNHYCFDSTRCDGESCRVVFWQHNLSYTKEKPPKTVNNSFAEWAKEVLVDWILEDYDHDGNDLSEAGSANFKPTP